MSRSKLSLILILQAMGIFALFRGLLLVAYYEEFAGLSLFEIVQAFIYGMRFDFALLAAIFAIPLLMLNLPFKWFDNRGWASFWYWLCLPILIATCLLLATDIAYYAFVKRHITQELRLILNDTAFILQMALSSYKLSLAFFAAFCSLLFLLWRASFPAEIKPASLMRNLAIFILLPVLILVGIHGGLQRKTIHIIDAYSTGNPEQGNLILNGAYSALRSFDNRISVRHDFYTATELEQQAKQIGLYSHSHTYPFQKQFSDDKPTGLNVVVVVLESWSYKYIDGLAGNNYGVTPNFDQLVKDGLVFNRFYAAGQRSIEGLQAILTGVPNLVDLPSLGWGLESNKFSRLGDMVSKHGYHTLFAQSSRRTSFHIDSISAATGFNEYYGMEDMQLTLNYADPESFWYGWDHETFNKVQSRLKKIKQPFFSFVFTGTTHSPYGTLPVHFLKRAHAADNENGFLNTLYYADWAIGQFMKEARQQPWFDNTVFIFTADHTLSAYRGGSSTDKFHIPLLIYSPKHIKPGINNTISSHFDIMPTIIDLLGLPESFSTFGDSLLRKKTGRAFVRAGNIMGLITDDGYLLHTLKKVVEAKNYSLSPLDAAKRKKLERQFLTLVQLGYLTIQANNWAE
ncbi:MAG: sulfatase-like hydrolase/transferase [Calditrichaceae bacterium]